MLSFHSSPVYLSLHSESRALPREGKNDDQFYQIGIFGNYWEAKLANNYPEICLTKKRNRITSPLLIVI